MLALLLALTMNAQAYDQVVYTYNAYTGQFVPVGVVPVVALPTAVRTGRYHPAVRHTYVERQVYVQPAPTVALNLTAPTWSFTYAATPPTRVTRRTVVTTTRTRRH